MGLGRLPTFHFLFFFSILRILGILVVRYIIIKKLMIVFELKKSFFYRLQSCKIFVTCSIAEYRCLLDSRIRSPPFYMEKFNSVSVFEC